MSIVFLLLIGIYTVNSLSGIASFTYYESYAPCCPENENYDPDALTEECDKYSACDYTGDFEAIGHQTYDYVRSHNLVAFFDSSDPHGNLFDQRYAGKNITLWVGDVEVTAIIADTCANSDCGNCCSKNARPSGYLVDMEYWTVINTFGSVDAAAGSIYFSVDGNVSDSWSDDDYGNTTGTFGVYDFFYYLILVGLPVSIMLLLVMCCCRYCSSSSDKLHQSNHNIGHPHEHQSSSSSAVIMTPSRSTYERCEVVTSPSFLPQLTAGREKSHHHQLEQLQPQQSEQHTHEQKRSTSPLHPLIGKSHNMNPFLATAAVSSNGSGGGSGRRKRHASATGGVEEEHPSLLSGRASGGLTSSSGGGRSRGDMSEVSEEDVSTSAPEISMNDIYRS